MTTIVTTVKNAIAPAGAPVLTLPTPEENALMQSPNLTAWWRPDYQYNAADRWVDKKNENALERISASTWPDVLTGINGKPYINRNTGTSQFVNLRPVAGSDVTYPIPPAQGYTFAWVGKPVLFDRPAVCAIFAPEADASANVGYIGYDNTSRRIWVRNRNAAYINYGIPDPTVEHSIIVSFDYATQAGVLILDGVQVASGTSETLPFSDGLTIFGPYTPAGTALGNGSFAGHIYDLLVFDDALHMSRNADQLNALTDYTSSRYSL